MKILFVTGGAGFIGSNFINKLFEHTDEYRVINFDALYYCANELNIGEYIRNNARYQFTGGGFT